MCNLASHEFQSKTFGFGISVECMDCGEIFYAFFSESRAYKREGWADGLADKPHQEVCGT